MSKHWSPCRSLIWKQTATCTGKSWICCYTERTKNWWENERTKTDKHEECGELKGSINEDRWLGINLICCHLISCLISSVDMQRSLCVVVWHGSQCMSVSEAVVWQHHELSWHISWQTRRLHLFTSQCVFVCIKQLLEHLFLFLSALIASYAHISA